MNYQQWFCQLLWVVVLFGYPSTQQASALKTLAMSAHHLGNLVKRTASTALQTKKFKKSIADSRMIAVSRSLRIKAHRGEALSAEQWDQVYRGWLAELEDQGTEIFYRQHAYNHHLLAEHYAVVKNLTAGIPKMNYAPQFLAEMQMITENTPFARQLQEFIDVGNLQEVVWFLDEVGFTDASIAFEKLLSRELKNGKIEQLLSSNVVKFKSGIVGFLKGNDREFLTYKIDNLLKTKTFPLTIQRDPERVIDGNSVIEGGPIQLVVENPSSMLDQQALGRKYHAYQRFIDEIGRAHV